MVQVVTSLVIDHSEEEVVLQEAVPVVTDHTEAEEEVAHVVPQLEKDKKEDSMIEILARNKLCPSNNHYDTIQEEYVYLNCISYNYAYIIQKI